MGREEHGLSRREREKQSRREDMLNAAKAVFAERGYAGATLDEIAQRAEFGKGTIYNYFPDGKEEILLAILEQLYDGLCDLISDSFENAESRPFREVIQDFIGQCFDFFTERINLFMILIKETQRLLLSTDSERASHFVQHQERVIEALTIPLQNAMDRGELRPMNAHILAHVLFGNIKGCHMRQCMLHPQESVPHPVECTQDEMVAFLSDLMLHGIALQPEASHV